MCSPKMDGENKGKPYEQMDDLGVLPPLFLVQHPNLDFRRICPQQKAKIHNVPSFGQRLNGIEVNDFDLSFPRGCW